MNSYFSADFFLANRARLRDSLGSDSLVVISGNEHIQKGSDTTFPFHQDANFWYLTGLEDTALVLVIDGQDEFIIAPDLSSYQTVFDGTIDLSSLTTRSGVATILGRKEGWRRLKERIQTTHAVAVPLASPPYISIYGMLTNPVRARLIRKLKTLDPKLELTDIRSNLASLRVIKQKSEIRAIQDAIELTSGAMQLVHAQLSELEYEYQVEAKITGFFLKHGSQDAWKPTVGSGANSCVLHSSTNRAKLAKGDVMVVDIGAVVEHYCSDITRTLSIGAQPSLRQQAIYDAVLDVQAYGFSLQKPGTLVGDNEKLVEAYMGKQLQKLGLITKPTHQAIRHYFPHATSHFLGIDPHDAGDYRQPLEPGMVLTVEPGIYVPEEGIGVRIEDDLLITPNGHTVLSDQLVRSLC
jgi:Xaa-Pro aminopeptidase